MELRGFSGSYSKKKSGVTWFFRELFLKKVDLRGYSGNYSKTGDTWLFRENVEKSGDTWFFLVLIQDSECTSVISVTTR